MENIEIDSKENFHLNDEIIKNNLKVIDGEVRKKIVPFFAPKSIILRGSFGRDEVSFGWINEKITYYSDCEIIVINPKNQFKKNITEIATELSNELQLKVEIADLEPELKYFLKFGLVKYIIPTIDNYELKYGSKVIYGENFLEKLPIFNAKDIPIWEGIRLILNRMIECSHYFNLYNQLTEISDQQKNNLYYWINKLILACQDALLILIKKYHYSYRTRNKIFVHTYLDNFSNIHHDVPSFLQLTIHATKFKLNHNQEISKDLSSYWFIVSAIVDKVFRHIINTVMNFEFVSYFDFHKDYLTNKCINRFFFRGASPKLPYQNLRSLIKIITLQKRLPDKTYLKYWHLPWNHLIYSCVPLIYFYSFNSPKKTGAFLSENRKREFLQAFNDYISETDDKYIKYLSDDGNAVEKLYKDWLGMCY